MKTCCVPLKCVVLLMHVLLVLQIVHSKPQDLLPKPIEDDDPELQRPDEETVADNTMQTREALEKLVSGKISAAMPVRCGEKQAPAQYIRWGELALLQFYLGAFFGRG